MKLLFALLIVCVASGWCQSCSNDTLKIQQNGVPRLTIDSTGTVTVPSGSLSLNGGLDGFQLLQNFGQDVDVGTYSSLAIGTDGFPLISFYDAKNKDLKVAHCKNSLCNGTTIFTIDNVGDVGQFSKIAIGTDGFGIISYYDATNLALKVAHCSDLLCSFAIVSTIDTGSVGRFSAITSQETGFPLISYYSDATLKLKIASCNNVICSTATIRTVNYAGSTNYGLHSSILYNPADSLSIIAFYDVSNGDLVVTKCTDITCSTSTNNLLESTNDVGSWNSIALLGTDTVPWIAHVQVGAAVRINRCGNLACSSGSSYTADGVVSTAQWLSLKGDSDGYPIISYQENVAGGRLKVAHCLNGACFPSAALVYVATNIGANMTSLAIGSDGLPIISYYNSQTADLFTAHCNNWNCTSTTLVNVACCDRNQFAINRGLTQLFSVDDTGAVTNPTIQSIETSMSLCNRDGICGPKESLSCSDCKTNCLDIMLAGNSNGDGQYQIITANGTRTKVYCDMTRAGGGWTLISKLYYINGYEGFTGRNLGTDARTGGNIWTGGGYGTVEDGISSDVGISYANYLTGVTWYKMSDNDIRNSVIGPSNNFDIMFDQSGSQPTYNPGGNFEHIVIRNYTAIYTFAAVTPASSTPVTVSSYRVDTGQTMSTNLHTASGFVCGASSNANARGITCTSSGALSSLCTNFSPSSNPTWSLQLNQMWSNQDTYQYACGGYLASSNAGSGSGWKCAHRVWIRRRAPGL